MDLKQKKFIIFVMFLFSFTFFMFDVLLSISSSTTSEIMNQDDLTDEYRKYKINHLELQREKEKNISNKKKREIGYRDWTRAICNYKGNLGYDYTREDLSRDVCLFSNVMLRDGEWFFFNETTHPIRFSGNQREAKDDEYFQTITVPYNETICDFSFQKPFSLFGAPHNYGENYYHFHCDTLMRNYEALLFYQSLIDIDSNFVNNSLVNFVLSGHDANRSPHYLEHEYIKSIDAFTQRILRPQQGKSYCFDQILMWGKKFGNRCFQSYNWAKTIVGFHNYRYQLWNHYGIPISEESDEKLLTPTIGIIVREKRAILNPDQLLIIANQLSGGNVVLIDTDAMTVREQFEIFRNVNILIGIHGAGLTNLLFLPDNSVVLELFPYRVVRGPYQLMSSYMGHSYLYWRNTHPENLVLDLKLLEKKTVVSKLWLKLNMTIDEFIEKAPDWGSPEENNILIVNFWLWQDTFVDLHEFSLILEIALEKWKNNL